ncbi:MAG TPA: DUF3617 family protein [Sphingomicrobium sp.]|nr:DUF3617 family protein [Sphingomicrobium sp.]
MRILGIAAVLALAACSNSAPPPAEVVEAKSLTPGEYAMTSKITAFRSTDGATAASKAKIGDTFETKACVAADGTLDPAIFAVANEKCGATNVYASDGRMSIQMSCSSPDYPGQIMPAIDGKFTADHFEGTSTTTTYLTGPGDYALSRTVSATRTGECPPAKEVKS